MKRVIIAVTAALALAGCDGTMKVKNAVKATLIDPSSAQFRKVEKCTEDPTVWRGDVNGKNGMGAYVGFRPFFSDGTTAAKAGDDGFSKLLDRCFGDIESRLYESLGGEETAEEKAAELAAKAVNGEWTVREDVNPVDDSKSTYARLESGDGSSTGGQGVVLTARCRSKKTEIVVNWNEYLGDDSHDVYNAWKKVTVRVGSEDAKTGRWRISTNNEATFAPNAVTLAKRIAKADRLVLVTVPYAENPATAVFALKGANQALKAVAENCGWTLD